MQTSTLAQTIGGNEWWKKQMEPSSIEKSNIVPTQNKW